MNKFIEQIKGSASMELMVKAKELKEQGIDVIGLGGGEPDFETPQSIKDTCIAEIQKGNTHYAVGPGIFRLRNRIADKLREDNDIICSSEEIIVTPGGKMAIYLAVRACINEGDEVMILKPGWVSYDEIVVSAGGVPVSVELSPDNYYEITSECLEKHVSTKTKVLIVNSPNNPTGRILSKKEIGVLKNFIRDREIIIISDEIYEKIVFEGTKLLSPAADPELRNKTITINGFSKGYAMTGWRLGYLVSDIKIVRMIQKIYTHTITGTSPFIQEAAISALDCIDEVEEMRLKYEERRNRFIYELNTIDNIEAVLPQGAFYAWVKIELDNMNSFEIAEFLLENAHVIGVPGEAYSKNAKNYIRFSFANSDDDLIEAIKRIKSALRSSIQM